MSEPEARPSQKRMASRINRGLAWIGVASSLVAVLDIVALLVITRIIGPEQFGIAGSVMWILPILDQATDLGLSAAVIQRDDHDDATISTVFWLNVMMGVAIFLGIILIAPLVARPIVAAMLLVYGTKLVWQNVYFIPVAMMRRELRFKELSVIRIVANVAEFAGKVGFAVAGFGIWCFVLGPLCRVLVTGIGAQLRHPWRPKLVFKPRAAKEYVTFGLNTSGSQILYYFYTNIHIPIAQQFFSDHSVGLFRMATEIVLEPVRIISNVIVDIAFPAFARLRHSKDKLVAQLVSFTKLNLITVMLYSAVVFVAADDVVAVVSPDYQCAPAIRILCGVAILRSISLMIPPLLDGMGHPNRTFVYMLTASIALPLAFLLGPLLLRDLDYLSMAVAWSVGYPIAFAVLIVMAMYSLDWSSAKYFRAVVGVAGCMVGGAIAGYGAHELLGGAPDWARLAVTSVVVVLASGLLLAYTQGLSMRTAMRSMKAEADALPPPNMENVETSAAPK